MPDTAPRLEDVIAAAQARLREKQAAAAAVQVEKAAQPKAVAGRRKSMLALAAGLSSRKPVAGVVDTVAPAVPHIEPAPRPETPPGAKGLTEGDYEAIRRSREMQVTLARVYGISRQMVGHIQSGRRHAPGAVRAPTTKPASVPATDEQLAQAFVIQMLVRSGHLPFNTGWDFRGCVVDYEAAAADVTALAQRFEHDITLADFDAALETRGIATR